MRPEFKKEHIKQFHAIQQLKNEAMMNHDKKQIEILKVFRVQFKVRKFCNILLDKCANKRKRRTTIGLSSVQQASLAVTKDERSVGSS